MPPEIKKEACLRVAFFCQMRQKDQKQRRRILSYHVLTSISFCAAESHTVTERGGHKPNNARQTTLCICMQA